MRLMVIVSCKRCGGDVKTKPSHLALGFGKYCSRSCHSKNSRRGKVVQCATCAADTYKRPKDLIRSKSKKYFCSKSCQTQWRNQMYVGRRHSNYSTGKASYRSVLRRSGVTQECRRCKIRDVRILAVHHIDRNRNNNSVENLMYLCHNCHHLIHWFRNEEEKLMATMV